MGDLLHRPLEREICDGRRYLGTVRETTGGAFVAIVREEIVGSFSTIAEATDRVLELGRGSP